MNKERIKNWVLIGLVILSFGLTTQLWLSIPIEQMVQDDRAFSGQDSKEDYDLSSFVLPQWIVVNFGGQSHTKLINDSSGHGFYNEIYAQVSETLEYIFSGGHSAAFIEVQRDEWAAAREGKSIEIEYAWPFDAAIFRELFGGRANQDSIPLSGIKGLTITLGSSKAVYLKDGIKGTIYKLELPFSQAKLDVLAHRLEERDPVKYWTLKEIGYSDDSSFYVPLDMSSFNLPVGTAVRELDTGAQAVLDAQASSFFSDMSLVRKITEMDGSVIYTDSQSALLRIDSTGFLEYMVYSYAGGDKNRSDINSAIDAALAFIHAHGGIPGQLYLQETREAVENDYRGHVLKFNYAYNGLPFFRRGGLDTSAIEVMVVGGKVVKYTRNIHNITRARIVQKPLLYPVKAADVVAETISRLEETKRLPVILDMYLGYCIDTEGVREHQAFPVWYIRTGERAFIVDAYEGKLVE
jgi:regulatory protein YycH of two-component signal transduction system YycFG